MPHLRHLIMYLLVCTIIPAFAQQKLHFDHIGVEKGVPNGAVRAIFQDQQDYIWFGTADGMCRYDGEKVKVYPTYDNGIELQYPAKINTITEDSEGQLWAASGRNIFRYSAEKDVFEKVGVNSTAELQRVRTMHIDMRGNIWVGSQNGLFRYSKESDEFFPFITEFKQDVKNQSGDIIHSDDENLWFSSLNGLYKYQWSDSTLIHYEISEDEGTTYFEQPVLDLYTSKDKNLWLGTKHLGLMRYDRDLDQFVPFPLDHPDFKDEFTVRTIEEGKDGKLWINAFVKGSRVYIVDVPTHLCQHIISSDAPGSIGPIVMSIFRDKCEDMWLSTMYDGVYHHSRQHKAFTNWKTIQNPSNSLVLFEPQYNQIWLSSDGKIDAVPSLESPLIPESYQIQFGAIQDKHNQIWTASWLGLRRYDPSGEVHEYVPDATKPGSIPTTAVPSVLIDHDGMLWLGPWGQGLYRYVESSDSFAAHPMIDPFNGKLIGNHVHSLFEDSHFNLWVGSESGLIKLGPDRTVDTVLTMASCGMVHEDDVGFIWLATHGGLVRIDPKTYDRKTWLEKDGLSTNRILSIMEDDHGHLWLGSQKSLCRFTPSTQTFRNYDISDGITGDDFVEGGAMRGSRGQFYFSTGPHGILEFHPDSIRDNPNKPPVVITEISLRNHHLSEEEQENIFIQARASQRLQLDWRQNDFVLEFAALNFFHPEKNQYKYRLENYDQDWIHTDAAGSDATYTNLDPGQYVFQVQGSNNDGVWNEEGTSLLINIVPPWWETYWAYTLFALLGLFSFLGLRKYEMSRQRLRHQLELEHVKSRSLEETNSLKSRFFSNISHEFRTPLTLILGPISDLITKFPKSNISALELVQRNSLRLMTLINQLLDLSKLDAKKLELNASKGDMVPFLAQIYAMFTTTALSRDIDYSFHCQMESLETYVDWEKLEQIILNLLDNSFKFTPEGGRIGLELSSFNQSNNINLNTSQLQIRVLDSGPGIPPEHLSKIFDRFYQVDETNARNQEGTGIGLSLVKELVELHSGTIDVESSDGEGTQFTLCLPKGKDYLLPDQIMVRKPEVQKDLTWTGSILTVQPIAATGNGDKEHPLVLVAEDNSDMRSYIRNALQDHCRVVESPDGQQALDYALKEVPDLIISDVMMPVMDGLAFCQTIKEDGRTSHIPVILLTAKADIQDRIDGLQHGADAYLAKPFHKEELLVRMRKLLELRLTLQARYLSLTPTDLSKDPALQKEDVFITTFQSLMEENLSDDDFGTAQLCRSMHLSRAQLYRKIKALTGHSVGQYISLIRLNKAKSLLSSTDLNISEVAYEVGFKDPAYFSKLFKETFGASPSNCR